MACKKCGYRDSKQKLFFGHSLCEVCKTFAPTKVTTFQEYINEKIDWKVLDTFRRYGVTKGEKQKEGMNSKASKGNLMTRPPLGYSSIGGILTPNEDSSRVHSLFRTYLSRNYSLNSLSKNFGLSVNGLKKVLQNRTYLSEIKFDGKIHKSDHKPIISQETFYAVQGKLKENSRKKD